MSRVNSFGSYEVITAFVDDFLAEPRRPLAGIKHSGHEIVVIAEV